MNKTDNLVNDFKKRNKDMKDKYFGDKEEFPPKWSPEEGEVLEGVVDNISEVDMFKGSIVATIEKPDKTKVSWWLSTVARRLFSDLGGSKFDKEDFDSVLQACKSAIGKGMIAIYDGEIEGKNYSYKGYRMKPRSDLDRKFESMKPRQDPNNRKFECKTEETYGDFD